MPTTPAQKIDITIVVDMLLTGFDSKYLNTLYVDKNLKHHGLIQAFSRTNRVLNGTKPYGNILDFRQQQDAVDAAIALFSGEKPASRRAKSGWWTRPRGHPKAGSRRAEAGRLHEVPGPGLHAPRPWPTSRATTPAPPSSPTSRKCSASKPSSTNTPTSPDNKPPSSTSCPRKTCAASRGLPGNRPAPQSAAGQARQRQRGQARATDDVDQLDFEFVLFASAVIDYDYIMGLMPASPAGAGQAEDDPRASSSASSVPTPSS
jgi:type I restriction enzyme R subunit